MRKAFDANVPKLKPRLRPAGVATLEPEQPVEAAEAAPGVQAAEPRMASAPAPAPAAASRAVKQAPAVSGDLAERPDVARRAR